MAVVKLSISQAGPGFHHDDTIIVPLVRRSPTSTEIREGSIYCKVSTIPEIEIVIIQEHLGTQILHELSTLVEHVKQRHGSHHYDLP